MNWQERIIAAHTAVTTSVSHSQRLKSSRYFVWQEDGQQDFEADGKHGETAVTGMTDLYTKQEFDPWKSEFEEQLDASPYIAWSLSSVQYEDDTEFYHYEWRWAVI